MHKADNLNTILCHCHVNWEPKLPGNFWAPRACNGTDLPFTIGILRLSQMYNSRYGAEYYFKMGAGKSLARPTSPCRRTESIIVGKGGSVHVPNCKSFLLTEAERKHVRRRARVVITFFSCKARCRRKFTPFSQKHQGNMHHRMPPSKNVWPSLNVVIFPPVCASSWTTQNSDHAGDY